MEMARMENARATVRIHDDFFDLASEGRMENISRIVTEHYKRRYENALPQTAKNAANIPPAASS